MHLAVTIHAHTLMVCVCCLISHTVCYSTYFRASCGKQMVDRIDVTHIVLSGSEEKEASWTICWEQRRPSALPLDVSLHCWLAEFSNHLLLLKHTWKLQSNQQLWKTRCCTYTASVWSELRKRPCSRFSLNTSELKWKEKYNIYNSALSSVQTKDLDIICSVLKYEWG